MRTIKVTIGLAVVAICAFGALAVPAFAKEKIVFGEFQASVTGKNLETEAVPLSIFHEDQPTPSIEGLQIGPYKFGPIFRTGPNAGKVDTSHPCKVAPKLTGKFQSEAGKVNKSDSLLITLHFRKCITRSEAGTLVHEKSTNFALSFRLEQNFSSEVGTSASGIEIEPTTVSFKGGVNQCPVIIPRQTLPGKDNTEHEYEEIVSFSNESEPVENWEKSKKLKTLYPNGLKERLFVEFVFGVVFAGKRLPGDDHRALVDAALERHGRRFDFDPGCARADFRREVLLQPEGQGEVGALFVHQRAGFGSRNALPEVQRDQEAVGFVDLAGFGLELARELRGHLARV